MAHGEMTDHRADIDITLLLEGTYPYIKGGVSSWVHGLIGGLPHFHFACIFLGSRRGDHGGICYELPTNIVHLETHHLFDYADKPPIKPPRLNGEAKGLMSDLHIALRSGALGTLDICDYLDDAGPLGERAFLYSEAAWQYITEQYEAAAAEPSFVDYFWSVRNLHSPLWVLARIASQLPPSQLFFSPSTGYAGLLAAFAARHRSRPFILMEHGIYIKERRIDLMKAEWIRDSRNIIQCDPTEVSYLRELWVHLFEVIGRLTYQAANPIISLFDAARTQQIRDGAPAERTRIIPNGIDIERLSDLRRPPALPPPVICLLGRVVPIKDIKTFIRAAQILCDALPQAQAWIVGPEDEDPEYSSECHELVNALGLGEHVQFLGFRYLEEILPKVGLLVLSSISEGLPLVVIEGFAAGLPVITTEVGACPELINGHPDEMPALGAAGRVVGLADPEAMASACLELLIDPEMYADASQAAISRVERYYDRRQMLDTFNTLFREHLGSDD